jgi:signal transduction histidine kinase
MGLVQNQSGKGRGLENIKSRIEFMQGDLNLKSQKGETRYTITIPTNENDKRQINLYL